ncbi:MAG: MBL fold metallo-hydrolase [Myxococcota bacterium]|nr:MBL fold metallo-hydrolase [Myxococcota bacterium]
MFFRPFYRFGTGCAAYVFGCGGKGIACVVDPHESDVDAYVEFATSKGMKITHVFDTHVHADHRSGARRLVEITGAKYCLHKSANVTFPFEPVVDDQVIELGNTIVRVLHTPGHTPESMCLVVSDLRRGPEPWFVCTGDTLFVGAVGRPDLPGRERENAAQLRHSVRDKLLSLPGDLEVYPAHFAGSACGAGMSGKPASTIAFEKRWNGLLGLDEAAFVDEVGGNVPPKPDGMIEIMRFNAGR